MCMDKKICTNCNNEKLITEFYKKSDRKNGGSMCKKCFNTYCSNRWVKKKIDSIIYKGGSCMDCHISYPEYPYVIFDFHHIEQKTKDVDWSKLRLRSWPNILLELDKCDLLCSNCHRIRHHNEWSQRESNPQPTA